MAPGKQSPVSFTYSSHNQVQLVRGGRDFFTILYRLLEEAEQTVHLQIYIFEDDETGDRGS